MESLYIFALRKSSTYHYVRFSIPQFHPCYNCNNHSQARTTLNELLTVADDAERTTHGRGRQWTEAVSGIVSRMLRCVTLLSMFSTRRQAEPAGRKHKKLTHTHTHTHTHARARARAARSFSISIRGFRLPIFPSHSLIFYCPIRF